MNRTLTLLLEVFSHKKVAQLLSASSHKKPKFLVFESLPTLAISCKWHELWPLELKQTLFAFGTDPHGAMPQILHIRRFLSFLHANSRQHIHRWIWSFGNYHSALFHLEQSFLSFLKFSMRFSCLFLWMEEENQHFPKMKIICNETRDFTHKTKINNRSRQIVYQLWKLGSWIFGYVTINQHSLKQPSLENQREPSCAPSISAILEH